jgi:hypothetical protein
MYQEQDTLYRLLPAYIRSEDKDGEGPIKELLTVIGRHARLIEQDVVRRMYDDWFIETCQDWVVPYIADLLGYESMSAVAGNSDTLVARRLAKVLSPRREIGNLLVYRRRKGTLWLLEELARDIANWPAHAVEFYRLLSRTEHLDHPQPQRLAIVDIHDSNRLELAGTAFDNSCHTVDVRRINSEQSPGCFNIPNVGLFVFRTKRYSVTKTPAYCREEKGLHCFTFSILGNDVSLYRKAVPERDPTSLAGEENFPIPIRRRSFENRSGDNIYANESLYGEDKSLVIYAPHWPKKGSGVDEKGDFMPIDAKCVKPADLSDWAYLVPKGYVAVDPILGRIKFPKGQQAPTHGVFVSYGYGFVADIGGGEYERPRLTLPAVRNHFKVNPQLKSDAPEDLLFKTIDSAYQYWRTTLPEKEKTLQDSEKTRRQALVIELIASAVYKGRTDFDLNEGEYVAVVASNQTRPIIWLSDESVSGADSISIKGQKGARVIFDGIMVTGRGVEIFGAEYEANQENSNSGDLCEVLFRHTTLVPGWGMHCGRDSEPSLLIENTRAKIRIESSIVGAIQVNSDSASQEPIPIAICDSIVDAGADDSFAVADEDGNVAYANLRIARSTVVGKVFTHAMLLAENSLFTADVQVARKQIGCIRYSHVPIGSRTPARYHCQPKDDRVSPDEIRRLAPCFESNRYGTPNYMRLAPCTAYEIKQGADDESEMGVYHDLFEPQRFALLTRRLEEFVPASTDSAVIFAT